MLHFGINVERRLIFPQILLANLISQDLIIFLAYKFTCNYFVTISEFKTHARLIAGISDVALKYRSGNSYLHAGRVRIFFDFMAKALRELSILCSEEKTISKHENKLKTRRDKLS